MAYRIIDPQVGMPKIADIHTVGYNKQWKLGDVIQAFDTTYGTGEFIYLKGVASNFVGALVTYVANTGVVVLSTTSGIVNGGKGKACAKGPG